MNKWLSLLIGLILVLVPIYLSWGTHTFASFGSAAVTFLQGGIFWLLVLIGLLLIVLGIKDL